MRTLYINTTGKTLEICFKDNDQYHHYTSTNQKSQSEEIIDAIATTLHNTTISDIDLIITNTGPGSFTGIRLGLSVIKGFQLATKVRIIPIDNFFALYLSQRNRTPAPYNIALDASGNDYYFATLDENGTPTTAYTLLKKDELKETTSPIISDFLKGDNILPAKILPEEVIKFYETTPNLNKYIKEELNALYIKPHYAKTKQHPQNKTLAL